MDNIYSGAIRVSPAQKIMVMPFDNKVNNIIPNTRIITRNGSRYLLVNHGVSEVKVLSNLGYEPPAPIYSQYPWPGIHTPYQHQKETAGMLSLSSRAYVMSGLGSGKTRSALFAFDYLRSVGEAKKLLVVAPLSTLSSTWEGEVFSVFPHLKSISLHGTKKKRLAALDYDADVYVINHDGLYTIADEVLEKVKSGEIDTVVIDELAAYRNAKTRRWKTINRIVPQARWVWGMSGLPTPNGAPDAWAQVKLLTPENVPKYFGAFRHKVMQQISQFIWVPRKDAMDIVHKAMQPSVRFATEDCIDLPPTTYLDRECELSKEQAKAHKEMFNTYAAEIALIKAENDGVVTVSAANAGVKLSKLLQISGGFAYAEGVPVVLDDGPRIALLHEILDQVENKVLIFAPFKFLVDRLEGELINKYGPDAVVKCYGDTPKTKRDHIFNTFQNSANPKILVAHPACLSHGVTLTAADTIIWYSPIVSYETYTQANARIVRAGQDKHTNIIHMVSDKIEAKVYAKLQRKEKAQNVLLDMFNQQDITYKE